MPSDNFSAKMTLSEEIANVSAQIDHASNRFEEYNAEIQGAVRDYENRVSFQEDVLEGDGRTSSTRRLSESRGALSQMQNALKENRQVLDHDTPKAFLALQRRIDFLEKAVLQTDDVEEITPGVREELQAISTQNTEIQNKAQETMTQVFEAIQENRSPIEKTQERALRTEGARRREEERRLQWKLADEIGDHIRHGFGGVTDRLDRPRTARGQVGGFLGPNRINLRID